MDITGLYQHYKGNEYQVIGEGTHTETGEKYVVYASVKDPAQIWLRPYAMFFETVEAEGQSKPRFEKVIDRPF